MRTIQQIIEFIRTDIVYINPCHHNNNNKIYYLDNHSIESLILSESEEEYSPTSCGYSSVTLLKAMAIEVILSDIPTKELIKAELNGARGIASMLSKLSKNY